MSLKVDSISQAPEDTVRVAKAVFCKGNRYILLRDTLGDLRKDIAMPANLYLIDPKIPFEPPPATPEPDAPFMPPPGPGVDPEVPNKPSPDNVPDLPDRPQPDPEVPKPQGTDT